MIVDERTYAAIGGAWLRTAIAPVGDFGRRAEDALASFGPGDESAAHAACATIVALASTLDREGVARVRAALPRAPDPSALLSRARAGDPLDDVDFYELGRFVDVLAEIARAWDDAGGARTDRPATLDAVAALLAPGRGSFGFTLADAFARELPDLRRAYDRADARVQAERARLASALGALLGVVPQGEEFIAMRDVLPVVPAGVRIVRETPAYRTLALELDAAAIDAARACEVALSELAACEFNVRRELAHAVAADAPAILAAMHALGQLDCTLARVAFVQRYGGIVPEFVRDRYAFEEASFVPLAEALAAESLAYTPIALELRGVAVITGPNMGGKTAALATCGFLALCASRGVPPPARAYAAPLFARIAWIGGESGSDRTRLLSSFGLEVARASEMLAAHERPELVLVDEFARTTSPREGRALTIALVEALARRSATSLVATHFEGVALAAGARHVAIAGLGDRVLDARAAPDLHAALDAVARAMDYRIVEVLDDAHSPSDALALAGVLGLDPAIVERAAALYATGG